MRTLGLCVVALVVLAGCGDKPTPQAAPPSDVATGTAFEDGGVISGIVIDDSNAPIVGVTVGILELKLQVLSGDDGSFRFENVPPGQYQLQATMLGFESFAARVQVDAASEIHQNVQLVTIPVYSTFQSTFGPYSGFFTCAYALYGIGTFDCGVAGTNANDKNVFDFNMDAPNYRTIYGELRWTPAAAGTTPALASYITYKTGPSNHWWCASDGPSPNFFRYDVDALQKEYDEDDANDPSVCSDQGSKRDPAPGDAKAMDNGLYMATDSGFPGLDPESGVLVRVVVQQKFDAMLTVFYGEPAPKDFSGFPDA